MYVYVGLNLKREQLSSFTCLFAVNVFFLPFQLSQMTDLSFIPLLTLH